MNARYRLESIAEMAQALDAPYVRVSTRDLLEVLIPKSELLRAVERESAQRERAGGRSFPSSLLNSSAEPAASLDPSPAGTDGRPCERAGLRGACQPGDAHLSPDWCVTHQRTVWHCLATDVGDRDDVAPANASSANLRPAEAAMEAGSRSLASLIFCGRCGLFVAGIDNDAFLLVTSIDCKSCGAGIREFRLGRVEVRW